MVVGVALLTAAVLAPWVPWLLPGLRVAPSTNVMGCRGRLVDERSSRVQWPCGPGDLRPLDASTARLP